MRWTRAELKAYGKQAYRANRWKAILVGLILSFLIAGNSNSGNNNNSDGGSGISLNLPFATVTQSVPDDWNSIDGITDAAGSVLPGAWSLALSFLGGSLLVITIIVLIVAQIALAGPLEVGCRRFFLLNLQERARVGELGNAFARDWINSAIVMFARDIRIMLWSLLLIIPGIIKSYEYRMVPYLLAEDPSMPGREAFEESRRLMSGNKWDTFVLDLSFIGWDILSSFTLGLTGIFFSNPYKYSTGAALYERLRSDESQSGQTAWF